MRSALLVVVLLCIAGVSPSPSPKAPERPRAAIMIVGVAHLVAKADLHNSTWGQDALGPAMQAQIKLVVARLAAFRPTKVMIEADPGKPVYVERYKAYLAGRYSLGPNEDDQFGYRLAAMAKNPTIYPIDTHANFPFHYDAVQASARRNSQTAILAAADAHIASLVATSSALEKQNRLLDVLRYINTPASLDVNASWYTYVDRIGNAGSDYAGANLVSYWYARNLHIFANIMHVVIPGDRVVIFIGQGHAAILRPLVILSPDLRFVSPLSYLR